MEAEDRLDESVDAGILDRPEKGHDEAENKAKFIVDCVGYGDSESDDCEEEVRNECDLSREFVLNMAK